MKTILCFGDSNTWGFDPTSITTAFPARHPIDVRWTGVLARELGPDFRIIEEGQNGRTTVHHDPFNVARRGLDYLPACLESHKPIDLVVMMLGSNDLKAVFNVPPSEVASGAGVLARMIVTSQAGPDNRAPQLLLLCPPPVGNLSHLPLLADKIQNGSARSRMLPTHFEALAKAFGCGYLNTQDIVTPSHHDGIHLDASEHQKLGLAIAAKVRSLVL
jgi:lysophospholipase L1-like esterase